MSYMGLGLGLTKELLRVAVVGMGKMGLLHTSILNLLPGVQLVAACEKSAITRRLLKKALNNIVLVQDINEFSEMALDAVYVTTPIPSHFGVAKTVYQKRLAPHLFIEKPLTSNYPESKELCDLAKRNGGVNMVGYLRRFMVTFMKAKELLVQGSIGKPVSFSINAFSSDFYDIREHPEVSVARSGVLRDLGSHAIDIALWFFSNFQINSAKIESLTGASSEDAVYFTVKRESDSLQGEVSVSWCMDGYRMPEVNLTIRGSKGTIEVNDDNVSLSLSNRKSTWLRHDLDDNVKFWLGGPEYYREDAYFIKSITTNSIAEPSFNTASNVDLLIDVIQQKAGKHD